MKTTFKKLSTGLMAIACGLILAFTGSAFTSSTGKVDHFYRYKLNTYTQIQIENPANYQLETSTCNTGVNLCGVYLETDNGPLSQPDTDEFNAVKSALWASEQADAATIPAIKMRN